MESLFFNSRQLSTKIMLHTTMITSLQEESYKRKSFHYTIDNKTNKQLTYNITMATTTCTNGYFEIHNTRYMKVVVTLTEVIHPKVYLALDYTGGTQLPTLFDAQQATFDANRGTYEAIFPMRSKVNPHVVILLDGNANSIKYFRYGPLINRTLSLQN
jgi:hypothetical protein